MRCGISLKKEGTKSKKRHLTKAFSGTILREEALLQDLMLLKEQGGADVSTPNELLFRSDTFDLLGGEFAANLSYYRNYTDDDAIAGMFLGCALDIIDCTYYAFAKSLPAHKRMIAGSFVMDLQNDVISTHLPEDISAPCLASGVVEQHRIILDAMQDKYQWLVRGPRHSCWQESSASIAEGRGVCRARTRCNDEAANPTGQERRCAKYYASWRSTMLVIDGPEALWSDTAALADKIRSRCRVLALLTTPEGLLEFLDGDYVQKRSGERMRTVRGVIVRLLTMLVDESLVNLNRKMNLPQEEALYFSRPAGLCG
jgi:hypothetical protein